MGIPVKTKIYLDVDGVINAVQGRIRHSRKKSVYAELENITGWSKWFQVKIDKYWITVSSELLDNLSNITQIPGVEIVWVTTWNIEAITLLSPGIRFHEGRQFKYLNVSLYGSIIDNKWDAIRKDMSGNDSIENIIWIDDQHEFLDAAHMDEVNESSTTLVTPKTRHGLTKQDIVKIRQELS